MLGDGSHFWDKDVELLIEEPRGELLELSPGVLGPSERDVQILLRWILYGKPWGGRVLGNHDQGQLLIDTSKDVPCPVLAYPRSLLNAVCILIRCSVEGLAQLCRHQVFVSGRMDVGSLDQRRRIQQE